MLTIIKKALNSRLGEKNCPTLDLTSEKNLYIALYMFAKNNGMEVIEIPGKILTGSDLNNNSYYHPVFAPWIEEIADDTRLEARGCFLPPSIKKIGRNAFYLPFVEAQLVIPSSVKEINDEAFAAIFEDSYIIINKKRGELSNHPWGFKGKDSHIKYVYE